MNKRGTHVGFVFSFMIFIFFLISLYVILEPKIKSEKSKEFILDYLENVLTKEASSKLTIAVISINSNLINPTNPLDKKTCVNIEHPKEDLGLNSVVKDKNNNIIDSKSSSSYLTISHQDKTFFKIYYSKELFNEQTTAETDCNYLKKETDYSADTVKNEYIFETKISEIKGRYETDYEGLKDDLKMPNGEFSFSLKDNNEKNIISTPEKQTTADIYVKEIPIQYVDKDANIKSGIMNIKVW